MIRCHAGPRQLDRRFPFVCHNPDCQSRFPGSDGESDGDLWLCGLDNVALVGRPCIHVDDRVIGYEILHVQERDAEAALCRNLVRVM